MEEKNSVVSKTTVFTLLTAICYLELAFLCPFEGLTFSILNIHDVIVKKQ